jgi:TonB-dependent receptor-like protein
MKSTLSTLIAALLVAGSTVQVWAQVTSPPRDLTRVSIENLLNSEITSAAKKEQRAEDVPAAVFVITQDDIRRSGLRSLPELFRLVPGMQIAQVNASMWAVSTRGFNDLFSNKLLVLVDGRSIYNHAFSGVFWDLSAQGLCEAAAMLEGLGVEGRLEPAEAAWRQLSIEATSVIDTLRKLDDNSRTEDMACAC